MNWKQRLFIVSVSTMTGIGYVVILAYITGADFWEVLLLLLLVAGLFAILFYAVTVLQAIYKKLGD